MDRAGDLGMQWELSVGLSDRMCGECGKPEGRACSIRVQADAVF